ncbi:putative multicopper oxidase [Xylogone sp. PMI_703]|nr:putative multicopper oxidase [Xylogone sp. PMI_703]
MTLISSILGAANLTASLSQNATNGGSILGTLQSSFLPDFLTDNPLPHGYPWGARSAECTCSRDVPNTGVIRRYDWEIARGYLSPDGVNKSSLLINGQYPGPMIEANWGDIIQASLNLIQVDQSGPEEGTSLHWHGLLQRETPWFDGVPSVSQCPIAPNGTFTYTFRADTYGTGWYHSHYSAQYADGLFGPMVIYGPRHAKYDYDLGPVLINDYFHTPYYPIVQAITGKITVPNSDNNLINGKMNYDCSLVENGTACTPNAGLSKFKFHSGKTHRLRLINSGAEGLQKFTIDNHTMTVIANDFIPIKPYETKVVTLGAGQRTDILVTAHGNPTDAYWMRSEIRTECSHTNQSLALAAIYYEEADTDSTPQSTATPYTVTNCTNDNLSLTEPLYHEAPPAEPAFTQDLEISFGANETGALVWKLNNQSFLANYKYANSLIFLIKTLAIKSPTNTDHFSHPLLLLANLGNTSYPDDPQWNVYNFGNSRSIRLVIHSIVPFSHPMHLHGHDFWVVAQGMGKFNGTLTRPENPQRRDTQLIDAGVLVDGQPKIESYIVLDFIADNPGVWPLHCHVAWHVSDGLYINIMERPDEITQRSIPSIMAHTCRKWWEYSGHNVVDQIDSGL